MLPKDVYPYEYMDSWKDLMKHLCRWQKRTSQQSDDEKKTDSDYKHPKTVWKYFRKEEYHDLHAQSDTVILILHTFFRHYD